MSKFTSQWPVSHRVTQTAATQLAFFFWPSKSALDFIYLQPKQCTEINFPKGKEIEFKAC